MHRSVFMGMWIFNFMKSKTCRRKPTLGLISASKIYQESLEKSHLTQHEKNCSHVFAIKCLVMPTKLSSRLFYYRHSFILVNVKY